MSAAVTSRSRSGSTRSPISAAASSTSRPAGERRAARARTASRAEAGSSPGRAREHLAHEERVAGGERLDGGRLVAGPVAQRDDRRRRQGRQRDPARRPLAGRLAEGLPQGAVLGQPVVAVRRHDQRPDRAQPTGQVTDQVEGRLVGEVQVLQRRAPTGPRGHRARAGRRAGRRTGCRGGRPSAHATRTAPPHWSATSCSGPRADGVNAPSQALHATRVSWSVEAVDERLDQAGLADARLAGDQHQPTVTPACVVGVGAAASPAAGRARAGASDGRLEARSASAAASWRLATPSLASTAATWWWTVRVERTSRAAMAWSLRPSPSRRQHLLLAGGQPAWVFAGGGLGRRRVRRARRGRPQLLRAIAAAGAAPRASNRLERLAQVVFVVGAEQGQGGVVGPADLVPGRGRPRGASPCSSAAYGAVRSAASGPTSPVIRHRCRATRLSFARGTGRPRGGERELGAGVLVVAGQPARLGPGGAAHRGVRRLAQSCPPTRRPRRAAATPRRPHVAPGRARGGRGR